MRGDFILPASIRKETSAFNIGHWHSECECECRTFGRSLRSRLILTNECSHSPVGHLTAVVAVAVSRLTSHEPSFASHSILQCKFNSNPVGCIDTHTDTWIYFTRARGKRSLLNVFKVKRKQKLQDRYNCLTPVQFI